MKTYNVDTVSIEKRNSSLSKILFLLSPVLAVYTAFKNYRSKWAKNIIWLFVIFYGANFVISRESMDASRYRDKLIRLHAMDRNFDDFSTILYSPVKGELDILNPAIMFVVSSFTNNYQVLFAVYGLIFGFFYSRNIWYFLDHSHTDIKRYAVLFLLVITLVIGFWSINGFRFWCAAQVFIYGVLPYIFERKTNRLWIAFATILIHFSFFVPVFLLIIYIFFQNKVQWYYYFFLFTFFVNTVDLELFRGILSTILPDILQQKALSYTDPEYAERLATEVQGQNLYAKIYKGMLGWAILVFFSYFYFWKLKAILTDTMLYNLFNFSMLFLGVSNLLSLMPSGHRFENIGNFFAFGLIFLFLQHFEINKTTKNLIYLIMPIIFLFTIVSIRISFDTISITTIVGNPIVMFFTENDWPLIDLLK